MLYRIFGPFRIKRTSGWIDKARPDWWEDLVDLEMEDLRTAKGIYVFGLRSKGSSIIKPWYVGKTERKTFQKECFAPSKLVIYNKAMRRSGGKPFLYLLPRMSKSGKIGTGKKKRDIAFLEKHLISCCLQANPRLFNQQGTKYLRKIVVPGLLNWTGHPGAAAIKFRKMMGA